MIILSSRELSCKGKVYIRINGHKYNHVPQEEDVMHERQRGQIVKGKNLGPLKIYLNYYANTLAYSSLNFGN